MNTITIICTIIGGVAALLGGFWFIINKAIKGGVREHRLTEVEDKVRGIDCKNHAKSIEVTTTSINKIFLSLENIEKAIISFRPEAVNIFSKAFSPRQLNDLGKILYKVSGADKILDANKELWINMLKEQFNLKTALDVESYSNIFLIGLSGTDEFIPLKNYVYNHPTIEYDDRIVNVTMNDICFVMSLELRNAYLDQHPELQ